jgi:gliding motility-associated lipoprotein GldJ
MKNLIRTTKHVVLFGVAASMLYSCGGSQSPTASDPGRYSTTTGLEYNSDEERAFEVKDYRGQPEGPNLVFMEGGRTVLGSFEEDITFARDNIERTVTVASFYMDETEVANIHWLEYLHYVRLDSPNPNDDNGAYRRALPDTTVWVRDLAFNDPYKDHYFRYPGFRYYPVVGVTWRQAVDYSRWRTAVVNQKLYEESDEFDDQATVQGGRIPLETGVVLPDYRLPTEAEWEYAAQALIGTQWLDENQTHKRIYPWDGHALRNPYGKEMGYFLANFKRGRGDYAGIAGKLNDGAMITAYIYEYPPNDYGLYNMAGNVNEWVLDVYRPLSFQDIEDLNPIRRSPFDEGVSNRANISDPQENYNVNMTPGLDVIKNDFQLNSSLIHDRVRVYKGGSWADIAYWLSPGTRRFLAEDSCSATIGFRCAMIRAGSNF